MKKTTRNYFWVLTANFLLIGAVAALWQFRINNGAFPNAPPVPVLQGEFKDIKIAATPKKLKNALYLSDLKNAADVVDLTGQWTLLNLWASWCGPCIIEMPALEKLAAERPELRIIAISVDSMENAQQVEAEVKKHKFPAFARNWDYKSQLYITLLPEAMPTTYVIDPQGRLFATIRGDPGWETPDAKAFLDSLLKPSRSAQVKS